MIEVHTADGNSLDISGWRGDSDDTLKSVLGAEPVLGPLDAIDSEVDPKTFVADVAEYIRETLRLRKAPFLEFQVSGMIGPVAYWVFRSLPQPGEPIYAMLVRNEAISELVLVDAEMDLQGVSKPLSAAQAALWDFCVSDYRDPTY